ncbi:MAG: HAD family hydrolase [Candidatus Rokubacteria bacterium]|nr:HAD family hydrolase [Candidatus Rokubacteria bacterium]
MPASAPALLALDFDGVLCDGMREYFAAAWGACRRLWPAGPAEPPAELFDRFARLRPVVENGWEMPLLLRALLAGADDDELLRDWQPDAWLGRLGVARAASGAARDAVRDEWIARDEAGWLDHHRFYPGVLERVRALADGPPRVAVVTTKEGRFARQLLARAGVALGADDVVGKEARRPKPEILRELLARHGAAPARLWFVEDRLKTLEDAKADPALAGAGLFLAAWGYNTPEERERARRDDRITLLPLERFGRDFAAWRAPRAP